MLSVLELELILLLSGGAASCVVPLNTQIQIDLVNINFAI